MPPPTHPKRASSRLPLHAPYVCFCFTGLPLPASGVFKNCGPVTARTACTCLWPAPSRGRARAQPSLHDHVALVVALSRRLVELVPQGRAGHDWALWLQALRQTSCATCALAASASLAPFRPGSPLPVGERVESRAAVVMLVCDRALHQHIAARGPCWPGLPYSGRQLVRSHTPPDTDHYPGSRPGLAPAAKPAATHGQFLSSRSL